MANSYNYTFRGLLNTPAHIYWTTPDGSPVSFYLSMQQIMTVCAIEGSARADEAGVIIFKGDICNSPKPVTPSVKTPIIDEPVVETSTIINDEVAPVPVSKPVTETTSNTGTSVIAENPVDIIQKTDSVSTTETTPTAPIIPVPSSPETTSTTGTSVIAENPVDIVEKTVSEGASTVANTVDKVVTEGTNVVKDILSTIGLNSFLNGGAGNAGGTKEDKYVTILKKNWWIVAVALAVAVGLNNNKK